MGLGIYILATLGCLFSHSIESLVLLRLLQALGGCAANVAAMAMVRDLFSIKESSKVFSLLVLILGVSPLIAPTVGGFVTVNFGWHSIFIILAIISILILSAVVFLLPESHAPDLTVSLKPKPIFKNFVAVFKEPQFFAYTLTSAVAFSGLFVYVAGSPIIFMDIFKVDAQTYSWIFAGLSIGFIGSSQLNIFLIRIFSNESLFFFSLLAKVMITIIFFLFAYNDWLTVSSTVAFLFFYLACVGLINPNGAALALAPFSKNAGSASALMGFLQMGAGALASMIVGIFAKTEILPVVAILAGTSALSLLVLFVGKRRITTKIEASLEDATNLGH
ncbi:Bicyclomycin resistance protein [compost metagenome]